MTSAPLTSHRRSIVVRPLANLTETKPPIERDRRRVRLVDLEEQRVGARACSSRSTASISRQPRPSRRCERATATVRISPRLRRAAPERSRPALRHLSVSRAAKPNTVSWTAGRRTRRRSTDARNPRDGSPRSPDGRPLRAAPARSLAVLARRKGIRIDACLFRLAASAICRILGRTKPACGLASARADRAARLVRRPPSPRQAVRRHRCRRSSRSDGPSRQLLRDIWPTSGPARSALVF